MPDQLAELADELGRSLGAAASVEREFVDGLGAERVVVEPHRTGALSVSWLPLGSEVILETGGGPGGRWELDRESDLNLLEGIVRSVIAGRVEEVHALGRSRMTVTLEDGRRLRETGADAPLGCLPIPFWTRWGHKIRYLAYGD